jgi:hypothetical protein
MSAESLTTQYVRISLEINNPDGLFYIQMLSNIFYILLKLIVHNLHSHKIYL